MGEASIMDELYESEINASIKWFWDGGFDVSLGDPEWNGVISKTVVRTWSEVEQWLENAAIYHYPQSKFALSRKRSAALTQLAETDGEIL